MINPARQHFGQSPGRNIFPTRWDLVPGGVIEQHDHDFYEVFWVEVGSCLHICNGIEQSLSEGDCVFISPQDEHSLRNNQRTVVSWYNVVITPETHDTFRRRYEGDVGRWPWSNDGPMTYTFSEKFRNQLAASVESVPITGQRALDVDWFLLGLLRMLSPNLRIEGGDCVPAWLEHAIEVMEDDAISLHSGLPALVCLCGKTTEHVNRSIRKHYQVTTTALVNTLRINYAARQLRFTQNEIVEIAASCGLGNLGHFYRLFKKQFDTTPKKFRSSSQSVITRWR